MTHEETTIASIAGVEIIEPERSKHARLPSDLLRMLVALGVAAVVALLGAVLDDVSAGATSDLIRVAEGMTNPIVVSLVLAIRLTALLLPLLIITYMLRQRRYRRLSLVVFAAAVAAAAAWLLESEFSSVFRPELGLDLPSWVCPPESEEGPVGGCVTASGFPSSVYLAGFAAGFGVLSAWVNRRWRIAGWVTIGVFLVARSIDGTRAPLDGLLTVALGYAIGAGTLLLFAAPDRRPTGADIVRALHKNGIRLTRLQWANVTSKGSTPYFATTRTGDRLFAKVMGPEEARCRRHVSLLSNGQTSRRRRASLRFGSARRRARSGRLAESSRRRSQNPSADQPCRRRPELATARVRGHPRSHARRGARRRAQRRGPPGGLGAGA